MSRRKSIIGWWAALAAAVVLAAAIPASAQDQQRGQGRGRFGGGFQQSKAGLLVYPQVQTELKLSDEQKEEVSRVFDDLRTKMREVQGGFSPEAREERSELAAEADKKVTAVLKDDQTKRLDGIALQVVGLDLLARDEAIAKKLDLTQEQQKKIHSAVSDQEQKRRELFSGLRGGQGEEGREERIAEFREKMQTINTETEQQIVAVLSDEQKKQLEEIKGDRFELDRSQFRGGFGGGRPRGDRN